MGSKKPTKKVKKRNPNLRLVKSEETVRKPKKRQKEERQEKLRFGRSKRVLILASILLVLLFLVTGSYLYIVNN